jgi:hypothetical protein
MPARTRILRPFLWVDATVAKLSDSAFRLYLGLTTCADDEGWLLWQPSTLSANLYRFRPVGRREAALEKGATELAAAGLLVVLDCGCAYLPYLHRDFRVSGGTHADTIRRFHLFHPSPDEYVHVRTSPAPVSVSGSVSDSASSSVLDSDSAPARKRSKDGLATTKDDDPWKKWNKQWNPVREAIARRGFLLPPTGETDEEGGQRDCLWEMVRENVNLVVQLIDEAPADLCSDQHPVFDLVRHVLKAWDALGPGVRS